MATWPRTRSVCAKASASARGLVMRSLTGAKLLLESWKEVPGALTNFAGRLAAHGEGPFSRLLLRRRHVAGCLPELTAIDRQHFTRKSQTIAHVASQSGDRR